MGQLYCSHTSGTGLPVPLPSETVPVLLMQGSGPALLNVIGSNRGSTSVPILLFLRPVLATAKRGER